MGDHRWVEMFPEAASKLSEADRRLVEKLRAESEEVIDSDPSATPPIDPGFRQRLTSPAIDSDDPT